MRARRYRGDQAGCSAADPDVTNRAPEPAPTNPIGVPSAVPKVPAGAIPDAAMVTIANAIAAAADDRPPHHTAMEATADCTAMEAATYCTATEAGATAVKASGGAAMETAARMEAAGMAAAAATAARAGERIGRHQGDRKHGRRRKSSDPQSSSEH